MKFRDKQGKVYEPKNNYELKLFKKSSRFTELKEKTDEPKKKESVVEKKDGKKIAIL